MLAGGTNHSLTLSLHSIPGLATDSRAVSTGRASTRVSRLRASFGCSLGPRQQSWVRVVLPDEAGGQGSVRTPAPAPASAQHQRGLNRLLRQLGYSAWGQPRSPTGWGQGVKARALCVLLIPRYLPDKPKLRHGSAESLTGSYAVAKAAAPCCQCGALLPGTTGLRAQPGCGAEWVYGVQGVGHGVAQQSCSRRALRGQVGWGTMLGEAESFTRAPFCASFS